MPTILWNRRWALDLNRHLLAGDKFPYGLQWGDPHVEGIRYYWNRCFTARRSSGHLCRVVSNYIRPYVNKGSIALEIGFGGGRWTEFLLAASEIVLVELDPEFFVYVSKRFPEHLSRFRFYQTSGYELDGVEGSSIDSAFSFGTFLHIEISGIEGYLTSLERVLRPGGTAVLHHSDTSKPYFKNISMERREAFTNMNFSTMQRLIAERRFEIVDHNRTLLRHSAIVVIRRRAD